MKHPKDAKLHQTMIAIASPVLQKCNGMLNFTRKENGSKCTELDLVCYLLEWCLFFIEIIMFILELNTLKEICKLFEGAAMILG